HEHAGSDTPEPVTDVVPARQCLGTELRQHVGHAADWSRDRDGKENHVQGKLKNRSIEFFPAIKIKEVTHRLEGPERQSQRLSQMREPLQRRKRKMDGHLGEVLEAAEQRQI